MACRMVFAKRLAGRRIGMIGSQTIRRSCAALRCHESGWDGQRVSLATQKLLAFQMAHAHKPADCGASAVDVARLVAIWARFDGVLPALTSYSRRQWTALIICATRTGAAVGGRVPPLTG